MNTGLLSETGNQISKKNKISREGILLETAEEKYKIIEEMISRDNNLLNISKLCEIAEVSRSGFYNWKNSYNRHQQKEQQDKKDFELLLQAYQHRGYDKGARSIHMRLLHMGIRMNIKKTRRLMKKYGLVCKIRKANPYRRMALLYILKNYPLF